MNNRYNEKHAYKAANGTRFVIRLVKEGESYGRDLCLTHDDPRTMIEFYDAAHDFTPWGQFVSRYYLETLLAHHPKHGLDLQGDVPAWSVDARTLQRILDDAQEQLKGVYGSY